MKVAYTGLFIFDGATREPAVLASVLETMEAIPELAPEYWGTSAHGRDVYSAKAIQEQVATSKVDIHLGRAKKLGYQAILSIDDLSITDLRFTFRRPPSLTAIRRIYESAAELAQKLPLVYGAIHPVARRGEEVAGLTFREAILCLEGVYETRFELKTMGLRRPAARTFYGPLLTQRIGPAALERAGAQPNGDGVVLDLVDEPWGATIPQLFEAQNAVVAELRPTGMFAERDLNEEGSVVTMAPGAAWAPPAWDLGLHDKAAGPKPDTKRDLFPPAWLTTRMKGDPWPRGGDISGLDLSGADVYGIVVDDGKAAGVNLRGARLTYFHARDSDFSGAIFMDAKLSAASLFDCKLRRARFEGASLVQAVLSTSKLEDAVFDGANLTRADLSGAWFDRASLRQAKLVEANLEYATLVGVDLKDADLTKANLTGADLTDADLRGATLTGVKWTRAITTGRASMREPGRSARGDPFQRAQRKPRSLASPGR